MSEHAPVPPWWQNATVYQVYLRSFADGNGDGTGDIAGLRSKLPYLAELGIDAVWINPWYVSPLHDGGYDVANYREIDPRFGALEEAEQLIAEARELGIRIIADLVPNHTSSEHEWFEAALAGEPHGPERARYHFVDGPAHPPNNWHSVFGGPAWTRTSDGQWYLHLFDVTQPDLNWNNDEVLEEMDDVLRFWLERGIAGFRVDVAHGMCKAPGYPDLPAGDDQEVLLAMPDDSGQHPFFDRDEVHPLIRRWRAIADEYDALLVAEAWVATWERLALYLRSDEYHQAFNFDFLTTDWKAESKRDAVDRALAGSATVDSTPTWVLSNHDVIRHPTRYGLPADIDAKSWLVSGDRGLLDRELGLARARAMILFVAALPGSLYIYQGEELGIHEVVDLPEEVLDDPVWLRSGGGEKGRDGCRVPLPWSRSGPSFGFGSGEPWLPQPDDFGAHSVEAQAGVAGSTLELYRAALRLRRELPGGAELTWLDSPAQVLAYRRGDLRCWLNLGGEEVALPEGEVVLASADVGSSLPGNTAVWLR